MYVIFMLEKINKIDWFGGFMNIILYWSTKYFKICEYFMLIGDYYKYYLWRKARLFDIKIVENSMRSRACFSLVDIKLGENAMIIEARFWLLDSKTFENSMVRLDDIFSARLKSISILIFFHVKSNWLKFDTTVFYLYSLLRLLNSSFLKIWDIINFPLSLSLLFEMPSLNRNETVAWLEWAENTHDVKMRQDIVSTVAFKSVPIFIFIHIAARNSLIIPKNNKHSSYHHNVKLCAQQSQNAFQERVKLIYFY